jgi:hypothetical protein
VSAILIPPLTPMGILAILEHVFLRFLPEQLFARIPDLAPALDPLVVELAFAATTRRVRCGSWVLGVVVSYRVMEKVI